VTPKDHTSTFIAHSASESAAKREENLREKLVKKNSQNEEEKIWTTNTARENFLLK
jgi:hypothetical protein